ncbi:MAG TPA: oligosaccharide flippase family protein [Nocardioidaceae bacterium]
MLRRRDVPSTGGPRMAASEPPDEGDEPAAGAAGEPPSGSPGAPGPGIGDSGSDDIHRRHVRGSALLVMGRAVAMVIGMATQVVIVRALTKEDFGAFAYALALASAARILLSLGQGRALSRFMAGYEEDRDYPRMFGAMFLAIGTIVTTSVLFIGAFFLFSEALVGSAVGDDAIRLVLVLLLLSPLEALDQVFVSIFAVFSKPGAIFFRKHLLAPTLRLVVVVLLVLTGSGVMFVAVGYVLAALVGVLMYVGLLVRVLRERGLLQEFDPRKIVIPFRAVFSFSFPLITGELALLSLTTGGVFVLAFYHSTVEVADYRAVFSSARLNTAVTSSFSTLFLPVIARLYARADMEGLRRSYWNTATFVAVLTFPVFALTGPLAPSFTVTLFGERYAGSATVLSILAVGYYINVMLGFNAYALQVCGRIRYLVVVNVFVAVLNIALCFLFAPQLAAVGIALANCIALVSQNLLNQWVLRGSLGTGFIARGSLGAYGVIALGAGTLWAFQLLASPGFVVSLVAAGLVSFAVLMGSRNALRLGESFPELLRLPLLGRLLR